MNQGETAMLFDKHVPDLHSYHSLTTISMPFLFLEGIVTNPCYTYCLQCINMNHDQCITIFIVTSLIHVLWHVMWSVYHDMYLECIAKCIMSNVSQCVSWPMYRNMYYMLRPIHCSICHSLCIMIHTVTCGQYMKRIVTSLSWQPYQQRMYKARVTYRA